MPYGNLLADVVQGSTANTPPVFKDGNGTTIGTLCRAWVYFNGTGTVAINGSFNVSSITDNGTGNYTLNFTNAMPDANYSVSGFACRDVAGYDQGGISQGSTDIYSTTQLQIRTGVNGASLDLPRVSVKIHR